MTAHWMELKVNVVLPTCFSANPSYRGERIRAQRQAVVVCHDSRD